MDSLYTKVALTGSVNWRHVSLTFAIIKDYCERGMEEGWGSEEGWGLESNSNASAPNESYSATICAGKHMFYLGYTCLHLLQTS